jgi:hypothetical protein
VHARPTGGRGQAFVHNQEGYDGASGAIKAKLAPLHRFYNDRQRLSPRLLRRRRALRSRSRCTTWQCALI